MAGADSDCTYVFPRDFPNYNPNGVNDLNRDIGADEVVCGGPGDDRAGKVFGKFIGGPGDDVCKGVSPAGIFVGGGGNDEVVRIGGAPEQYMDGTFEGGPGNDTSTTVGVNGTFNGGPGNDTVTDYVSGGGLYGTFNGGEGQDTVNAIRWDGTFNGGNGKDTANELRDSGAFDGGNGKDRLEKYVAGTCTSVELGDNAACAG